MTVYPDAKLNIGLNVLRRRPDGYHDLETLFVHYPALHDELTVERAESLSVRISPCSWDPSRDLTVRAYEMLKADFDLPPVSIVLNKGIPVGAGLGGGSSDAAWMLRVLDDMFALGLDTDALAGYAARLGSDCAFFVYDSPMLGEGRGEVLTPFEADFGAYEFRVEVPAGVSVSTAEAYRGVSLYDGMPLKEILSRPICQWKGLLQNSFEPSVFAAHPQIAALKQSFYDQGAIYASMSGSGSAVFAIFEK